MDEQEDGKQKLQEKLYLMNTLRTQLTEAQKQLSSIDQLLQENAATIQALDGLAGMKNETLTNMGSGVYAKAKVTDDTKVMVEIGSRIMAEKTVADAKKTLVERAGQMQKAFTETRQYYEQMAHQLQHLAEEAQEMQEQ